MGFLSFLMLVAIAYLLWRIADQLPDLIFRLSEVQRDVAEVRRQLAAGSSHDSTGDTATSALERPDNSAEG
ncbi:MAG: hypothetical protein ACO3P1_06940 [Pseudomonadales bacterium]|jgi:hypothetical protein